MLHPDIEAFIVRYEGGNDRLEWPEGDSGVTAAYGYDFGYHTAPEIRTDWQGRVDGPTLTLLANLSGLKGLAARDALKSSSVSAVRIPLEVSLAVFRQRTVPKFEAETKRAFPGCDAMPALSYGALVSLVYNRGGDTSPDKPRRTEMANIRRWAADKSRWDEITAELAAMTRLWPDTPTASNLSGRRLAEAALFAKGLRGASLIDSRTLAQGDEGEAVTALQTALVQRMAQLSPDGKYGVKTRQAIWRYQRARQLPSITGVADADTLKDLGLIS